MMRVTGRELMLIERIDPDCNDPTTSLTEIAFADPVTGELTGRRSIPETVDSHSATRPNGEPILLGSQMYLPERQEAIPCHLLEGGSYWQMGFDNAVTRALMRDGEGSILLYDVASGEREILLPADGEHDYRHPSFIGESDAFCCQRFPADDRYTPDALILQNLATGEQAEILCRMWRPSWQTMRRSTPLCRRASR